MTELPFMGNGEHAYGPLDLIHSDVCGPLSINVRYIPMFAVLCPLMSEVVSFTSLPSSMIVHDLGTCIL